MPKSIMDNKIALRFLNMSPVVLVTSMYDEQTNIVTVNWTIPISFSPPYVAIVLGRGRYSHYLIESSRQFVINVPDTSMLDVVKFCGSITGRRRNKFMELEGKISRMPAISMNVPIISECFAHIECMIHRTFEAGDHTIFLGSVQSVLAEKNVFTPDDVLDISKQQPLIHLGGERFAALTPYGTKEIG